MIVQYGSEVLKACKLNSWDQELVFSEDGVDYQFTRHVIRVTGMLATDLDPATPLKDQIYRLRNTLSCPRLPLTLWLGDDTSDEARPPDHGATGHESGDEGENGNGVDDSGVDKLDPDYSTQGGNWTVSALKAGETILNNKMLEVPAPDVNAGPRVEGLAIHDIRGTRFAFVSCTFIAHLHACPLVPAILSNRWEVTTSIDEDELTRMTWSGVARVSPYVFTTADECRETLFPPLPAHFKPETREFRLSSDGLTLRYTITYREHYRLPSTPFAKLDVDYVESTDRGAITEAEIRIAGSASKSVSKAAMLQRASQIMLSLANLDPKAQNKDLLLSATIHSSLTKNQIALNVRVQKSNVANGVGVPIDNAIFGRPLLGSPDRMPDVGTRGTAMQKALAAAWKQCCASAGGPASLKLNGTPIQAADDTPQAFKFEDLPPPSPSQVSPGHQARLYRKAEQNVAYKTVSGLVVMPVAQQYEDASGNVHTAEVVRLHQPYTRKVIRYQAERYGQHPEIPTPNPSTPGAYVKSTMVEAEAPKLAADLEGYWYSANARHEIILDRHLDATQGDLVGGVNPMYQLPVEESYIPNSAFRDDLADDPTAGAGA